MTGRDFHRDSRLGLFVHYAFFDAQRHYGCTHPGVYPDGTAPASLDELADGCQVEGIAELAAAMHAEYCIFTAWHANMNLLYPSRVMATWRPGHSSRRDVVADLAAALERRGVRLFLYIHPQDGHDFSAEDQERLGWTHSPRNLKWVAFMTGMLEEVATRYRGRVQGYWVDGGIAPQIDQALGGLFQTIVRADPDCAVIQNDCFEGMGFRRWAHFTSRERVRSPFRATEKQATEPITDCWWAMNLYPVWTAELAYHYTVLQAAVTNAEGGGFAVAVSPYIGGEWEPGVPAFARQLGEYVARAGRSLLGSRPSRSFITMPGTSLCDDHHQTRYPLWVATESPDGEDTYVHVLVPLPMARVLSLPLPQDGKQFDEAHLLSDDRPVVLEQDAAGLTLRLAPGQRWQPLDTIVVLRQR